MLIGLLRAELLLVPLVFVVLLGISLADYNRRLSPVSFAMREQFGVMNAGLAEAIAGIEVVKANVQERYEWEKFIAERRASSGATSFARARSRRVYLPALVFSLCWAAAFLHALLALAGRRAEPGPGRRLHGADGRPPVPHLHLHLHLQPGAAWRGRRRAHPGADQRGDRAGRERGRRAAGRSAGAVAFENVSFGYGGAPVLQDITFTVEPGETVAIVGQTGSGKTSLTRLVNRIFDVEAGQGPGGWGRCPRLEPGDAALPDLHHRAGRLPVLPQPGGEHRLWQAGGDAARRSSGRPGGPGARLHHALPAGYDTEVGERGVTLSGGQRQRIAIARAFLTDPRILILDDSTSAIDSATEDQIQRAMQRISRQRTTFLITHRLSQIRWADRILVLRRGELVDQGTHAELMERSPDYRRIFARS